MIEISSMLCGLDLGTQLMSREEFSFLFLSPSSPIFTHTSQKEPSEHTHAHTHVHLFHLYQFSELISIRPVSYLIPASSNSLPCKEIVSSPLCFTCRGYSSFTLEEEYCPSPTVLVMFYNTHGALSTPSFILDLCNTTPSLALPCRMSINIWWIKQRMREIDLATKVLNLLCFGVWKPSSLPSRDI